MLAEQYSLAVAFVEVLTGKFIRTHADDFKLSKHVRDDLDEMLSEITRCSPRLGKVLERMAAHNAKKRFLDLQGVLVELGQEPPPPPPEITFDVFIGYRRATGSAVARVVKEHLENKGFRVFLDVDGLEDGPFPEKLLTTIAHTKHFLVILADDSLRRCRHADDWLRQEITHAIRTKRKIVPVMVEDFQMPPEESLPPRMRSLLRFNAVRYRHEHFDESMRKLVKFLPKR